MTNVTKVMRSRGVGGVQEGR